MFASILAGELLLMWIGNVNTGMYCRHINSSVHSLHCVVLFSRAETAIPFVCTVPSRSKRRESSSSRSRVDMDASAEGSDVVALRFCFWFFVVLSLLDQRRNVFHLLGIDWLCRQKEGRKMYTINLEKVLSLDGTCIHDGCTLVF